MNSRDSLQITLLRFPLIVGIVFVHAYCLTNLPDGPVQVSPDEPVALFVETLIAGVWAKMATPMFFLFSGYLLYHSAPLTRTAWRRNLKKRGTTLGVPYLFWNFLVFALYLAAQSVPDLEPYFTRAQFDISALNGWQRADLLFGVTRLPIDYQFWFVRDLLLLVVISPAIWLAVKVARIPTIGLLFLLWSELLPEIALPVASKAILFFSIGIALGQTSHTRLRIPHHAALVVAYLVLSLLEAGLRMGLDGDRFATALTMLQKFDTLVGITAVWHIAGWLRQSEFATNWLTYLQQYAFFTFCAHEPLLAAVKKMGFKMLGHETGAQLLAVFFGSVGITVLVCIGTGVLLQHFAPAAFRVLTGGRSPAIETSVTLPAPSSTPSSDTIVPSAG